MLKQSRIWDQRGGWSVSRFAVLGGAEMKKTRRKIDATQKAKIALEAPGEQRADLASNTRSVQTRVRLEEADSGAGGAGVRR
jgi:hypothetical protein